MNEEWMGKAVNALMEMRLVAEGAALLFELEAQPIYQRLMEEQHTSEAEVLDMLNTALLVLKDHIIQLQQARLEMKPRF